jgi:hypothetical protein
MGLIRYGLAGAAVTLTAWVSISLAAETKLTELNGNWRGTGTDRASPLELAQQTSCRATIHADETRLSDEMICDGQAGLHKVVRLSLTQSGDELTGSLSQTITTQGSNPSTLEGSVSGHRVEDTASLHVRFSGLTPPATVALKLNNPSSYSVSATSLGLPLMAVTFHKAISR